MPEPHTPLHLSALPHRPVPLAIVAGDPVAGQGTAALLRGRGELRVLPSGAHTDAEVFLVLADRVGEPTLRLLERLAADRAAGTVRFVLVGDGVREPEVVRAITGGLVEVIPRAQADIERVVRAAARPPAQAADVSAGVAPAWLLGQLRMMWQDVLESGDDADDDLEPRELAVLRLLADGWGVPEIAVSLSYSERTVKNIIHGVLTRLRLRNRTEAVAYALRCGAL
jgi:DNA-binding NarL/FixJ family response regulator